MIDAILWEIEEKKSYVDNELIETIYFGGGTPSVLTQQEIHSILHTIQKHFSISSTAEISLEANPDDMNSTKLKEWTACEINRLSIGIQSFQEEDLIKMNRSHNAEQALRCVPDAQDAGITNISIDLIFGYPQLRDEQWEENISKALSLNTTHLSCYAMTVEPNTVLDHQIRKGIQPSLNTDQSARQYEYLMQRMQDAGFEHYEISSFAKEGYRSKHNSNYWNQTKYIGIGPSAHSFNGVSREWNVANNAQYIQQFNAKKLQPEIELLTREQKFNETIMIKLRVKEGYDLRFATEILSSEEMNVFQQHKNKFIEEGLLIEEYHFLKLTNKGKLFADYVAMELFL